MMNFMEIIGVTETIVERLRFQIIVGELEPGQKLNENHLAASMGVSRPPIREAFRVLENDNLVFSIPRRGTYVSHASIQDLHEVYQVREMIECYAIKLLKAKNLRDLPGLASALSSASAPLPLTNTSSNGKNVNYYNPFPEFHQKLVEATANDRLLKCYNSISFQLARYQFMCFDPRKAERTQKEHMRIYGLIRRGDYDKAQETLSSHIVAYVRFLEQVLRKKYKFDL
jgi:DNA-binding GntR family transcriptional regulator